MVAVSLKKKSAFPALHAHRVALSVLGPKLLGNATTMVFAGVVGQQLPAGMTQQQAEESLRAAGLGVGEQQVAADDAAQDLKHLG